jgi:putative ABC transport system permease protein
MKQFAFIMSLAWRNIWRNKMRSLVIMLAVATGLLSGLGVMALYKGMMKDRVRKVITEETGHLQVHHPLFKKDYNPVYSIGRADSVIRFIEKIPEVKSVAPRTIVQGMLTSTTGSGGVQINGIVPEMEYRVSQLDRKIVEGVRFDGAGRDPILIGKKMADKLKIGIGSKIVLTFTDTANEIVSAAYRIKGIFASGNRQFDEVNVYVPISGVNTLLQLKNKVNEISVLLNTDEDLDKVKAKLIAAFPSLETETWKERSPETALMVNTVDDYSYIVIIIILLALAFGIINTMLMSVMERSKEIGMMKALGTSNRFITLMTLAETVLLTGAGIPAGLASALLLVNRLGKSGLDFSGSGREMMASFGFSTVVYPEFPWEKLPAMLLMTFAIAVLSWILPALRVIRMRPVDALRR